MNFPVRPDTRSGSIKEKGLARGAGLKGAPDAAYRGIAGSIRCRQQPQATLDAATATDLVDTQAAVSPQLTGSAHFASGVVA